MDFIGQPDYRLNESMGAGANIATLRSQLALLREQAEAVDAHIQELEARIEQYETQSQFKNAGEKQNRLEEGAERILKFLFDELDEACGYVEVMSAALGMPKGIIKYHCDSLYAAEMIRMAGVQEYGLDEKGRDYVVKNLLNN